MAALPAFLPQLLSNPSIQRALPAASGVPGLLFQHMSAAGLASGSTQGAFNAPPSCFASLLRQQYESVSPTAGSLSLHALAGKPLPGTGLMRRMAGGLAGGIAGGMAALSTLAAASGVVSVQSGEPGSEEVHAPDGSAQAESSLPADPSETPAMALQAAYMALVQASASPVIVTAVPRPESTGPGEGEQGAVTVIPAAPNPAAGASRLANAALSSAAVLVIDPALPLSAGAIAAGAAGAVGAATAEAISASTAEPAAAEAEADPVREAYEPGQVPGFPSGQSSAQDSGWPTGLAAAPTAGTAASITAAGGANTAPSGAAVPLAEGAFAAGGQPEPLPAAPQAAAAQPAAEAAPQVQPAPAGGSSTGEVYPGVGQAGQAAVSGQPPAGRGRVPSGAAHPVSSTQEGVQTARAQDPAAAAVTGQASAREAAGLAPVPTTRGEAVPAGVTVSPGSETLPPTPPALGEQAASLAGANPAASGPAVGSPSTLQKPDPGAKAAELAGSQAGDPAGEPGPEASAAPPALEGTWTEGPHRPVDLREPARVAEARSPSVSTTEAAEQVSRQLVQMAHSGPASVRLRLYPEELGRIDIRLTHTPSGLEVTLSADQANTARALESQLGQLRQSLAEAGLSLTSVDIHQGSLSSQGSWHSGENLAHGAAPHAAFTRQTNQEADIHRTNHRTLTSDGNVHVDFFI